MSIKISEMLKFCKAVLELEGDKEIESFYIDKNGLPLPTAINNIRLKENNFYLVSDRREKDKRIVFRESKIAERLKKEKQCVETSIQLNLLGVGING